MGKNSYISLQTSFTSFSILERSSSSNDFPNLSQIENFEIPGDSEGNLLLKRASNYNACAVDTFIYLDGKYIGKIGNGDYWQGNVPEGEHEIETVLSPGFHAAPKLLETYKASQIDRLQISVRDSETTVLWIRVKGSKFTLTKMSQ